MIKYLVFTCVYVTFVISEFSNILLGLSDIFQTEKVFSWFFLVAIKAVLQAYFDSGNLLPVNCSKFFADFRNLFNVLLCAQERQKSFFSSCSSSFLLSFCSVFGKFPAYILHFQFAFIPPSVKDYQSQVCDSASMTKMILSDFVRFVLL